MDQAEQLSELISDIYDAALDSSLWSDVVGKTARFVGGPAAAIFSKSPTAGNGHVYYESGVDPHYRQLYFDKYVKLDPATTSHYFADIGQPIAVADFMPYREFLKTRFYREWARPQGIVDFVSAVLDKSATSAAMFGVFRSEHNGVVDEETRRRMRLIVPHVRRAVLVGRLIELKSAEAAAFADTLDGLSAGMCLVDAAGRIVHANVACHVILDAGDFLTTIGGTPRRARSEDRSGVARTAGLCGHWRRCNRNSRYRLAAESAGRRVLRRSCAAADVGRPARHRHSLRRDRGSGHSQGGARGPLASGSHRPDLQIDPDRVARAACHR